MPQTPGVPSAVTPPPRRGSWPSLLPHVSVCPSAVFCRVYMPDHSYVTIRSRLSASVQDILTSVTEKLQYSEEQSARDDALILVTVASSGGGYGAVVGGGGGARGVG